MGTLTPVLGTITKTLGAINTISTAVDSFSGGDRRDMRAQQDLAMRNLQQSQSLSEAEKQAQAARDRAQISLDAKTAEEARRKALKRAMARQNVKFGAGGVSRQGSGEAVLLGLYNNSEDEASTNKALDDLRYNAIDSGLYDLQNRNVLERTQLAEKQRLDRVIGRY
jgi:colicin import membrane protein